ncbi:Histidine kinase,HAMP domain-containing protein,histidine kinase [Syntrophobacter sp. SbD1]|nr:Histidine kinase,HAMP domain-containing protein,histidine kinase [Syntrophobacter sp. SbD1]
MKLVHKIMLANFINILLIALTGFFAYRSHDQVLTKLRFVEIANDLNSSFLEMRLAEKNFFLYGDKSALPEIEIKIGVVSDTIEESRANILRAIGQPKIEQLESGLANYRQALKDAKVGDLAVQAKVREAGQKLGEFTNYITVSERSEVNRIIAGSRKGLFFSLVCILLSAVGITHLMSSRVLKSLKRIEKVTFFISEGDFSKIEPNTSTDECGLAISALISMAQELRNREEQVLEARKLASIGILIAGVAHEVGNPLNNISMMAQNFIDLYDNLGRDDHIEYMKRIEEETERIQRIVKDLLDFARPKKPDLMETCINNVVNKSMRLVQNMIYICNIEAELDLKNDLPSVYIDEHQVQGVLINLLTNALHASSPGDRLRISTGFNRITNRIEVEVEDSGKGIAPEMLPHIFDPFFTTKGASGTGLGLFVSYGIIKNHKGEMKVRSELGAGTCFTIELPVYRQTERSEQCLVSGL